MPNNPTGTWRFTHSFPRTPRSVPAARQFLRDVFDECDGPVDREVAYLLTTELVTNAIIHTHGVEFDVSVDITADDIRIGVGDTDPALPVVLPTDPQAQHGRGMSLVDRLAERWEVEREKDDGKRVTFLLGRPSQPS